MIDLYWLSLKKETPTNGYWDMAMLEDVFDNKAWDILPPIKQHSVNKLQKKKSAIVVLPARHHVGSADELNGELSKIEKVILFLAVMKNRYSQSVRLNIKISKYG
jgi:hypothetical protein